MQSNAPCAPRSPPNDDGVVSRFILPEPGRTFGRSAEAQTIIRAAANDGVDDDDQDDEKEEEEEEEEEKEEEDVVTAHGREKASTEPETEAHPGRAQEEGNIDVIISLLAHRHDDQWTKEGRTVVKYGQGQPDRGAELRILWHHVRLGQNLQQQRSVQPLGRKQDVRDRQEHRQLQRERHILVDFVGLREPLAAVELHHYLHGRYQQCNGRQDDAYEDDHEAHEAMIGDGVHQHRAVLRPISATTASNGRHCWRLQDDVGEQEQRQRLGNGDKPHQQYGEEHRNARLLVPIVDREGSLLCQRVRGHLVTVFLGERVGHTFGLGGGDGTAFRYLHRQVVRRDGVEVEPDD
uniref:Uncharacterized protein n=1 Tax=Anopheles atroparvus TaxID=41427 RepID=A0A182IQ70_ANOAO